MPVRKKRAAAEEDKDEAPASRMHLDEEEEHDDDSGSSPDESSDADGSDSDSPGSDVDVDFDLFNQGESDFLAVRALVTGLLGGRPYDVGGMADLIVKAPIGSVVKSDGQAGDALGVATVLPLAGSDRCLSQVRAHLLSGGASSATAAHDRAREILAAGRTALLVNERLVNMPPHVAPALLRLLFDEAAEELPAGTVEYYVLISPFFIPVATAKKGRRPPEKRARRGEEKQQQGEAKEGAREYKREEEAEFAKVAEVELPLPPPMRAGEDASSVRWTFAGSAREASVALFVRASDVPAVLKSIEEMCS